MLASLVGARALEHAQTATSMVAHRLPGVNEQAATTSTSLLIAFFAGVSRLREAI
jgi:hypothetical protein